MTPRISLSLAIVGALALHAGVAQAQARGTVYRDTQSPGQVRGIGTESQDILSMSDQMMRDMLTIPALMNAATPPRVIIDATYFRNESSEIIDKALITDRIRVSLNRAASGRVMFIGSEYADMVQMERELKDEGTIDTSTGVTSRYSQYTFELVDLEYGAIIWSNIYEFLKENQDHVVYR